MNKKLRQITKLFDYDQVIWVLILGIFLNAAYIAYLAFYPFNTLAFKNNPFPIVNGLSNEQISSQYLLNQTKTLKPGSVLRYYVDYCRYTKAPTQFTRTLRGPTTITLAANATSTSNMGCHTIISADTIIPDYVSPGKYHLDITLCWQVTPLQKPCKLLKTQEFEVTNSGMWYNGNRK